MNMRPWYVACATPESQELLTVAYFADQARVKGLVSALSHFWCEERVNVIGLVVWRMDENGHVQVYPFLIDDVFHSLDQVIRRLVSILAS